MTCPKCGETCRDGARYCIGCGARLATPCPTCRELNQPSARFCPGCGTSLQSEPSSGAPIPSPRPVAPPPQTERRPISVIFCDLVGSTPLSARLDPEDLRPMISGYLVTVTQIVQQHGGFVAGYRGDGVEAYFGWPQADEADAECAVRAALAVIAAVAQMASDIGSLQVRIGVATGLVIVGDLLGAGAALEHAAVGETPNLAARLQAVAAPDTVVVDAATYRLIAGLFDCRNLGTFDLKGFSDPIPAWRVLGEIPVQSRFEARHASGIGPLVDRDEDLEMLLRRWRQARDGEGRMVLISGDPGIGKSRLVAALQSAVMQEPHTSLRYFWSPHHRGTALHPVIARWEQAAGFLPTDTPETKLDKLTAAAQAFDATSEEMSLLAEMLSVPGGSRYPPLEVSPQRKKERTFATLRRFLGVRARQHPLLIICEDAHWADPSSLEYLDTLIDLLTQIRVLMVITYRSNFRPPWIGRDGVSQWSMNRLDRGYSIQLAQQVLEEHVLPSGLLDRIVAQTDGVPLFIEELTKALLESLERSGAAGEALGVPASLQGSLLARLDRLPSGKRVAQTGAVIGREFSYPLLSAVADIDKADLEQGLDQLVGAGLVFRRGVGSEATYLFKHALVQDAAFGSLLRSTRRDIHARVATVLENPPPDIPQQAPEVLGYHSAEAGRTGDALHFYRRAAEFASAGGAFVEAQKHLLRALELVANLPDETKRLRSDAELRLALGALYTTTALAGNSDAVSMFASAIETCRRIDDGPMLIRALWGHWNSQTHRNGPAATAALAGELGRLGAAQSDVQLRRLAASAPTTNEIMQGRGRHGIALAKFALADSMPHSVSVGVTEVVEPEIYLRSCLVVGHAIGGEFAEGAAQSTIAIGLARELKHFPSIALAMNFNLHRLWLIGDEEALRAQSQNLIAICEVRDVPGRAARARGYLEWLDRRAGKSEKSTTVLQALLRAGMNFWIPSIRLKLADVEDSAGDHEAAIRHIDEALGVARRTGEIWLEPELIRRRGELVLSAGGTHEEAEQLFLQVLDLARVREERLFELRSAVSLARLWREWGRSVDARDLLTPIVSLFTDGVTTPDLTAASSLLAEL
jgi:class 3 adenylate cyclase/tetratricopeptide (TPR) repeat protein